MRYLLLLFPLVSYGSEGTGAHYPHGNSPRVHVETTTRVLDGNTSCIDENNNIMVSDNQKVVEVVLRIYRSNRPVKVITLNVDI